MKAQLQNKKTADVIVRHTGVDPHHWVHNHADYLFAFAFKRLNNEELAKDLVQDTFLSALEKRHLFEGRSSEKTWLTAILKNKIYDFFRRYASASANSETRLAAGNKWTFFESGDGHWQVKHRPADFPVEDPDAVGNKEFHRILELCTKKLPEMWRIIFMMRYMDEEKTEFICRELNISAANLWVIIHRTKVNLRSCLQKNWC